MLIFLCLMAEAFFGYLLPGPDVYWGAQVIVNLFDAIPVIGPDPRDLDPRRLCGVGCDTQSLFRLHVIAVPLALLALVVAHLLALHEVARATPTGSRSRIDRSSTGKPLDGIPFTPTTP